jgi:hypothetical protein
MRIYGTLHVFTYSIGKMGAPLVLGLIFTMGVGPYGGAWDKDSPLFSLLQLIPFLDPGVASVGYALVVACCNLLPWIGCWFMG